MDKIEIDGLLWDIPRKEDVTKWNYREWKEARSTYREFWLERYIKEGMRVYRESRLLQMKNGTSASLDGRKLKDADLETARKVFKTIEDMRG